MENSGTTAVAPERTVALAVIRRLLARFESAGIVYCHWKSNDNLERSLRGIVDLDLLVDARASLAAAGVLSECGFKPLVALPGLSHPAIHSFLALDASTGRLAQAHVYYRLVTGEGHLKGYHLPWEYLLLSSRRQDPESQIYVVDPNIEMLVFMVRCALRCHMIDRVGALLRKQRIWNSRSAEFRWLQERVERRQVAQFAHRLLGEGAARHFVALLDDASSAAEFAAFRRAVLAALRPHRRFGLIGGMWHRWRRECAWLLGRLNLEVFHRPLPFTWTPATGGHLIAFVGADGSGKSSLARHVTDWLVGKVDVAGVYFGSGDGPASALRWPMQVCARLLGRRRRRSPPMGDASTREPDDTRRRETRWEAVGRVLWALTLSYEKRQKLRRAWHAHERGMVVICDRYPQNQVCGFMDGPLLSHWLDHPSRLLQALGRWERVPYEWADAHPPDLVVRLDVSAEVAAQRKTDMALSEISRRTRAVRTLRYPACTYLAALDVDGPFDRVLLATKRLIWETL